MVARIMLQNNVFHTGAHKKQKIHIQDEAQVIQKRPFPKTIEIHGRVKPNLQCYQYQIEKSAKSFTDGK